MDILKQHYNDTQMTDSNALMNALISRPEELSPVITHLAGREDKKFPLTMMTEGMGNVKSISGLEYEYRVNTRVLRTRPLVQPTTGSNLGLGGATFELVFPDKWFVFPYTLVGESGTQVRIMEQPRPALGSKGFIYTVRLTSPDPGATMPASDLEAGKLFGTLWANVGTDFSRGNASNWSRPGLVRHKIGTTRKSYQFSGNAANWVAEFQLPTKSGTTKMWMDYEEYQYMLQWKEETELEYWYGQQTYANDGTTNLVDENGQPIIAGPGLLEQIVNKDQYSVLTENKLLNVIGDLFYGMTDADNMQITLYTGVGGMREFDAAMKTALGQKQYIKLDAGKFVSGNGRNLSLGGYFTTYEHIDGHTINVMRHRMFDHGPIADARQKHPVTGYSLESYRMVFVDHSNYDGEANVQMINKKGREFMRWAVAGSVVPKGFDSSTLRASDVDGASVHFMKTGGIILRRFDTSLDLQCVAS